MRVATFVILVPLLLATPASADVAGLEERLGASGITASVTGETLLPGSAEVSVGVLPDGTRPSDEAMRKEFARRSAKFANYPQTNIPGEMWLYAEMDMNAPKLVIPKCELLRVIMNRGGDMGSWAQVYCPYWDKVGFIETMQACAYKGVTSVDWSLVNFKMYANGVGFTSGNEKYTFPASPAWGDVKNDPDRFKPQVPPPPAAPPGPSTPATPPPACGGASVPGGSGTCGGSAGASVTFTQQPPAATATTGAASPAAPPASALPSPSPAIGSATNTHAGPVTLRGGRALESAALGQIPPGAAVELLARDGDWCKVRYGGAEGYVRAFYLGLGR